MDFGCHDNLFVTTHFFILRSRICIPPKVQVASKCVEFMNASCSSENLFCSEKMLEKEQCCNSPTVLCKLCGFPDFLYIIVIEFTDNVQEVPIHVQYR